MHDIIKQEENNDKSPYIQHGIGLVSSISQSIKQHLLDLGPMRMEEMRLGIFKRGWAHFFVNLVEEHFKAGDLVFIREGSLLQVIKTSDDMDIEGIVINHNILAKVLDENRLPSFSGKHAFLRMQPNKEELRFIESILDQMTILVRQTNFYQTTLYHLMTALLSYSNQLFLSKLETQEQHTTHNQKIFGQFLDLVNRFATQEHTIDFYANRLCISPRYLGTIIKKVTGITAKAWIDRSIITAIKIELRHSEKGIKQLTDEMAFPNESFFCKYFKRLTGLTPMEYREKLERLE